MLRKFLMLCGLLALAGCITPYPDISQSRSPCRMEPGGWCDFVRETAAESYGYAMLSATAYRDEDSFAELPLAFAPRDALSDEPSGLAYSVFDRYEIAAGKRGKLLARVVAFRGTDMGSAADIFRGSFGNSQIELARKALTEERIGLALSEHPDAAIELTGHSLGGALAIQLSIEDPALKAYVFNMSPLFGGDPAVNDTQRLAVSEYGEFLRVLRQYEALPAANVVVVNCNPSASVGAKHSIRKLAECLTWIAAYDDPQALALIAPNGIKKPEVECGEPEKAHPGGLIQSKPCIHAPNVMKSPAN